MGTPVGFSAVRTSSSAFSSFHFPTLLLSGNPEEMSRAPFRLTGNFPFGKIVEVPAVPSAEPHDKLEFSGFAELTIDNGQWTMDN